MLKSVLTAVALLIPGGGWTAGQAVELPELQRQFEGWRGKERMMVARAVEGQPQQCGRLPNSATSCCETGQHLWIRFNGPLSPYLVDKRYSTICLHKGEIKN